MLSLHFSLAQEEGEEEVTFSDYIYDFRKESIISAASSLAESKEETSAEKGQMPAEEDEMSEEEAETEPRYYLLNGFCMNEPYDMTVTDMETGEVLQQRRKIIRRLLICFGTLRRNSLCARRKKR